MTNSKEIYLEVGTKLCNYSQIKVLIIHTFLRNKKGREKKSKKNLFTYVYYL